MVQRLEGRNETTVSREMNQLIENWNEAHPDYTLVSVVYHYMADGESKDICHLNVWHNGEIVWTRQGGDLIKLYNQLEEEWEGQLHKID